MGTRISLGARAQGSLRGNLWFQELRLDQKWAEDVVRLFRALAQRNYSVLHQEILDETAPIKRKLVP